MEARKQAWEHFDTCPFNTNMTEETADQARKMRALKESMARILSMQTTKAAHHKTTLGDSACNAGPKTLANKYAATETPSKATVKVAGIGRRPCPNQQMGCKWKISTNRATTLVKARNLAATHFYVCPKKKLANKEPKGSLSNGPTKTLAIFISIALNKNKTPTKTTPTNALAPKQDCPKLKYNAHYCGGVIGRGMKGNGEQQQERPKPAKSLVNPPTSTRAWISLTKEMPPVWQGTRGSGTAAQTPIGLPRTHGQYFSRWHQVSPRGASATSGTILPSPLVSRDMLSL